jgi:glucuronokinase
MKATQASARPRAGLLGNPSDLYRGRGIGFTFAEFEARVECRACEPGSEATATESELLQATRGVLGDLGLSEEQRRAFSLRAESNIPRQVGLSGSSAIVIAALRAICALHDLEITPLRLAQLALRVETEGMGITAGPMDRLVQAYEGVVAMDFVNSEVRRIDAALLPPLAILYDRSPGQESGQVHSPVRQRWEAGDAKVRAVMSEYRPLVERGLAYLESGDLRGLMACVDRNFDLRARVFPIGERDRAMIRRARNHGAAAKFCGSGGAILALHESEVELQRLCANAENFGFVGIRPTIPASV